MSALMDHVARRLPLSARGDDFRLRVAAIHEAGHVVVARTLGMLVKEAGVTLGGEGFTEFDPGRRAGMREQRAVWLAGDLQIQRFADPYYADCYEPSAADQKWLGFNGGDGFASRCAADLAITILRDAQSEVDLVAAQLGEARLIRW